MGRIGEKSCLFFGVRNRSTCFLKFSSYMKHAANNMNRVLSVIIPIDCPAPLFSGIAVGLHFENMSCASVASGINRVTFIQRIVSTTDCRPRSFVLHLESFTGK
jgi:hypothetical protein